MIHGNPVEPGRELGVAPEFREGEVDLEKYLLDGVLGLAVPFPQNPPGQPRTRAANLRTRGSKASESPALQRVIQADSPWGVGAGSNMPISNADVASSVPSSTVRRKGGSVQAGRPEKHLPAYFDAARFP